MEIEKNDAMSEQSSTEEEQVQPTEKNESTEINYQPIPVKRPVGRPRKNPIPSHYIPVSVKPNPKNLYHELDSQGISAKEIQKYLLKKKVKKYVQKYVNKYQTPTREVQNRRVYYSEEEEPFEEIEESSEEEQEVIKQQTEGAGSIRGGESSKTKLDQIMGQSRRPHSTPRFSSYRY
jgi:hypothetical protein